MGIQTSTAKPGILSILRSSFGGGTGRNGKGERPNRIVKDAYQVANLDMTGGVTELVPFGTVVRI